MAENRFLFYLSGLTSLSLFAFFLALFVYMMFVSPKVNQFALTKDNYISISIDMPKIETKSAKKSVVIPKKEVVEPTPVTPAVDVTPAPKTIETPNIEVSNLFNNVWTKKIKKKKFVKKTVNNKLIQQIQKKISTTKNNEVSKIEKKLDAQDSINTSESSANKSTANEINEYLAKIQALVYRYFNPPQNSQGNSVKAVIKLSSIGKVLDFRILNYSASTSLNDECDLIKDRLMGVLFPANPKNKSGNYIIILTSKE